MRRKLAVLFKLVNRFGLLNGFRIFYACECRSKGVAAVKLEGLPQTIFLRHSTTDIRTFYHVFLERGYLFKLDFEPGFIVDCGANIGLASLFFKSRYPRAALVAIEPEQSNFQMLERNTAGYSDISCEQSGIWNKNALLKVEDEYKLGKWGFTCREVETDDGSAVNAISVAEIMKRYQKEEIDILKIDIEGSEMELFSSGYESWLPHTKVIFIELHDWMRKGCSKAFLNAINRYDFSIYTCSENLVCVRN